jgi:hypothetical protein
MPKMSDLELKALLQAERSASLGGTLTSDLSTERAKAMEYYNGDMTQDMPAADGRSAAVSTDVADTIEGLMPSLMEIFAAGEEVVRFEPVGPEDEDAAMQETDYVNHVFMQKNPGFLILYTFIKDALLSKNGVVKIYWDKTEREERETYLDQDDGAFSIMASDPDAEITEHKEHKDDETGEILHDVTIVKRKNYGCAKVDPVPPEEFGISKFAKTIKDATYCFHQTKKTESELIDQGYDAAQVRSLPTATTQEKPEDIARDTLHEERSATDTMNKASRLIDVIEHYVRMDYEGEDKTCLYRVTTGGSQMEVLKRDGEQDVIAVDEMPFAAMTPIIVTHRFFGRSIADITMDIQRIKTALVRGGLDNVYLANNQRIEIAESHAHERTLDDLLANRVGGVVRTKQPGGLIPIPNQPIGDLIYPMIEYIDGTKESRTGVTRQSMGMDADALQNQSATAFNGTMAAAQAKTKLIARILAETGIRDLFALLHGCIRKNDRKENTVRLRNKWVKIDPRNWKTRDDMTINVGLGTGSRAEQVAHLTQILEVQKELILSPPSFQMLVEPKNVYNTVEKLIERVGLKTVEPYFSDPTGPQMGPDGKPVIDPMTGQPKPKQPPPPPPDPEMVKAQTQMQMAQVQAQMDEKADQRKAQIETVQAQADIATNEKKQQAEMMMQERDFQLKKELAIMQAQLDMQKFEREEARKDKEHQQRMAMAQDQHHATMQQADMGMVASQQAHEQKMAQAKSKPANGA